MAACTFHGIFRPTGPFIPPAVYYVPPAPGRHPPLVHHAALPELGRGGPDKAHALRSRAARWSGFRLLTTRISGPRKDIYCRRAQQANRLILEAWQRPDRNGRAAKMAAGGCENFPSSTGDDKHLHVSRGDPCRFRRRRPWVRLPTRSGRDNRPARLRSGRS